MRSKRIHELLKPRSIGPSLALAICTTAAMGYYNIRVTGDVFKLPYQLHEEQYASFPVTLWQSPLPPKTFSPNQDIRNHHKIIAPLREYQYFRNGDPLLFDNLTAKISGLTNFFGGTIFVFAVAIFIILGLPNFRLIAFGLGLTYVTALSSTYFFPHYEGGFSVFFLLVFAGVYHSGKSNTNPNNLHRQLALITFVALLSYGVINPFIDSRKLATPAERLWTEQRQEIIAHLNGIPGEHLVFVTHQGVIAPHRDFVFNAADIDHAKIVFARDRGVDNDNLVAYYKNRRIWHLREVSNEIYFLTNDPLDDEHSSLLHAASGNGYFAPIMSGVINRRIAIMQLGQHQPEQPLW